MPDPHSDRKTVIKHMLQALETPNKTLTKWEESFIESVAEQFEARGSLSERQFEILDGIYANKTA